MASEYLQNREWFQRFSFSEFAGSHNNASFKQVAFIIDGDEFTSGRRYAIHQFPQKDKPYIEDLGRSTRSIIVNGIFFGNDFLTQKDNLLRECEAKGAGELLHPYYGRLNVVCRSVKIINANNEGLICKFEASFMETGELSFPIVEIDTSAQVEENVNISLEATKSNFDFYYDSIAKQVGYIQGKREVLQKALDSIDKAKRIANMPSDFFLELERAQGQIEHLVLSATDLSNDVLNLITFGLLGSTQNDDVDLKLSFDGLKLSMDFLSDTLISSDDTTYIEQLVQFGSVISMCFILSQIEYESVADAKYYRDTVVEKLDDVMSLSLDDTLMQSLRDLRKIVALDIEQRSLDLPALTTYKPNITLPALVVSNTLYGSVEQEADILNRNKIAHPAFLTGNVELDVLLNVR